MHLTNGKKRNGNLLGKKRTKETRINANMARMVKDTED